MLTFFVRHKKDKRNKWVVSKGKDRTHMVSIRRALRELCDILNKNLKKHGLSDDKKAELRDTYALFKESIAKGTFSDFVIAEFKSPPGDIYANLPTKFMNDDGTVWRIEGERLRYKKQYNRISISVPIDNTEGVKVNTRRIFCIGLASESFRFWYSMSNENSERSRIDQIKVGINSIATHRQHLRKKISWELNPNSRKVYEERMLFIDEYLTIIRYCLENNPARIIADSKIVSYRTIKPEIANLNNKEISDAVREARPSIGTSLHKLTPSEKLDGVNLLQSAMGWGFPAASCAV